MVLYTCRSVNFLCRTEGDGQEPLRLTFGSFRTLGVLNVASTDALDVVVVKGLGNELPICLEGKERTLDLAVKERRPTRREAMLEDDWKMTGGHCVVNGEGQGGVYDEKRHLTLLPYDISYIYSTTCHWNEQRAGRLSTA